jgi:hypothetical protein
VFPEQIELATEELADESRDWVDLPVTSIAAGMIVKDPYNWWLGESRRVRVDEREVPKSGSEDERFGMVIFTYTDVDQPGYRSWAAYRPDMIVQVWR